MARHKRKRTSRISHINKCIAVDLVAGDNYIDLAQLMSQANRRTFSSGAYYYLKSITFNDPSGGTPTNLVMYTTPSGWVVENAYKHARKAWAAFRKATGVKKGRYVKFRPFMDQGQESGGTFGINRPLSVVSSPSGTGQGYDNVAGEYDPSLVQYEDHTTSVEWKLYFKLLGDHQLTGTRTVGMITEYSQFRLKPPLVQPATDADDQLLPQTAGTLAPADPAVVEENIGPPYAMETYAGEAGSVPIWKIGTGANEISGSYNIGMHIPCGLLNLVSDNALTQVCLKLGKITKF